MRIPTVTSLAVATLIAFGCSKTPEDKLIGEWKGTDSGGQTATQGASVGSMSSILQSVKDKYKVGAIIFSADKNGVPIFRTAIGNSTVGEPATTDMHFRIGAVGWQYLTELMLLMVEQGQLSLTDPVSKWYPNYPGANLAPVRMLAASSTGFGEYITPPFFLMKLAPIRFVFGVPTTSSREACRLIKRPSLPISARTGNTRIPLLSCWARFSKK